MIFNITAQFVKPTDNFKPYLSIILERLFHFVDASFSDKTLIRAIAKRSNGK